MTRFTARLRISPFLLVPALVLGGCGGDEAPSQVATAAVDTVDGVERLRYPGSGSEPLGWGLDTVTVLGDAFAEEAYQFNEVTPEGLAGDDDGSLLVLDRQGKRVLRYDGQGAHLGTYGREGEGPGELSQPLGLTVGPGDTIWVADFSNRRITGFPRHDGEARMLPFPERWGFPSPDMAFAGGGPILQFRQLFNFRRGASGAMEAARGADDEKPRLPLVRYDGELTPMDTLWTADEPPMDMVQLEAGGNVMITLMAREFHPAFLWDAFSDGAVVVSDTVDYVLRIVDAEGTVRRLIEREPVARAVTEADREAARDRVREETEGVAVRMGGRGPDEETRQRMLEQRLDKMTFADRVPRVVDLMVDPLDRIWVGVTEDVADEAGRIDIYDRDGRLVGELRDFPFPDVFLDAGRIGILRRDDLDVQQVVVLDIREDVGE